MDMTVAQPTLQPAFNTAIEPKPLHQSANLADNGRSDSEDELSQDVVSQFPFLNGYSHISLIFQPDSTISEEDIVSSLRNALDELTTQVPWLAGQVLHTPGASGKSGVYTMSPWPSDAPKNEVLRIKDCQDLLPPLAQILRASAPISTLDASALTPFPSLPAPHGLEPPIPVMVVQLNLLKGGLILNLSTHHMAIDGTGIVQIMRLLSSILQGRTIPPPDLQQANRDRRSVVPLLPSGEPIKDHSWLRAPTGYKTAPPFSPAKWCYYKLPLPAISALRKSASAQDQQSHAQLSENDLISAFCWQRITAVRLARGFSSDTLTKITRAIDARGAVGVPLTYLGHLTYHSVTQLPMDRVVSMPLHAVAQTLRRSLTAANNAWAIRSFATFMAREPDKTCLVYGGLRNLDTDLGTTAFTASQSAGEADNSATPEDFGRVLGKLKFMRRPNATPIPGTITVCPTEGGAVPIALCLPEADLEGLKKDGEWRRYARIIG